MWCTFFLFYSLFYILCSSCLFGNLFLYTRKWHFLLFIARRTLMLPAFLPSYNIQYGMGCTYILYVYRLALGTKMNRPRDELVNSGGRTNNFRLAPIHYVFQCLYGFYSIMHGDDDDDMFRKRCRSDRPTRRKRRRMAHLMHLISKTKSRALLILILFYFYFFFFVRMQMNSVNSRICAQILSYKWKWNEQTNKTYYDRMEKWNSLRPILWFYFMVYLLPIFKNII